MSTTDTDRLRGFRAGVWQPTPEKWVKYIATPIPTPDQVRAILERANAPTRTKAAKRRRIAPGGDS